MLLKVEMILTVALSLATVGSMNNEEIASSLSKSRQMLQATVCGKRNFGYKTAKKAVQIFGGSTEIWQDPELVKMRIQLFKAFKKKVNAV